MGIIKLKSLLTESLAELYHATQIHSLLDILKSNSLKLTFAGGSQADQQINKGKNFFLSTMRLKYGSYAGGFTGGDPSIQKSVVINVNATEVSRHDKIISVDYWGPEFKKAAVAAGNPDRTEENEDRIISDKSELKPLRKYVNEIHIYVPFSNKEESSKINEYLLNKLLEINEYSKNSNYPTMYFYIKGNETAFRTQQKSKSLRNLDSLNLEQAKIDDPHISSYNEEKPTELDALISIVDKVPQEKFIDMFSKFKKEAIYEYDHILKLLKYYNRDLKPVLTSAAHNLRSHHHPVLQRLSQAIRKAKKKNLIDFIDYAVDIINPKSLAEQIGLNESEYGHTLWIKPNGKVIDIPTGNMTHYDYIANNFKELFPNRVFSKTEVFDAPYQDGWIHIRNHSSTLDIDGKKEAIKKQKSTIMKIIEDRLISNNDEGFSVFFDWTDTSEHSGQKNIRGDTVAFEVPKDFDKMRDFFV